MAPRLRVLIGAYAFGPSDEPEASAGWAFALAAARDHDVWVVCRRRFVAQIADYLAAHPAVDAHLHVVHVDLPDRIRRFYRRRWDMYWYYILWQRRAAAIARELHERVGFDIVHHVTFANDWLPSGVSRLRDVPFVWGPVGGATRIPVWRLRRWLGRRGVTYEALRAIATDPPRRFWGDAAARRASVVVAQNEDVAYRFRRSRRVVIEPNASLDTSQLPHRPANRSPRRHAVFVGRLIPLKGGSLAINAIARAHPDWKLTVYGDGPERAHLERLASTLGLHDRVRFAGHRPRAEALSAMADADILLFPSMHDQAGWAAAEASSMGTPVVCLPLGGPPTLAQPNAFVASLEGDIVANIVAEMERAISEGGRPHDRWSVARLGPAVNNWYSEARRGPDE